MPRRGILTPTERESLFAFPAEPEDLVRHYTLSEADFSVINQRRGDHNRLGFAVQLCCLRYPGYALAPDASPPEPFVSMVSRQLNLSPGLWSLYGQRAETRREHLLELQAWLGLTPFGIRHYRSSILLLTEIGLQTDRGIRLATALVESLRQKRIIVPAIDVIERVCAHALTRGTRRVHDALTGSLTDRHSIALDGLIIPKDEELLSPLAWLQQPPGAPNAKNILLHIDRLRTINSLGLPDGLEHAIHQNRLF